MKPDLMPLKSVSLYEGQRIELNGLVVIIGPSSSGKTLLLREIQRRLLGLTEKSVVADKFQWKPIPPIEDYMKEFLKTGEFQTKPNPDGMEVLINRGRHMGKNLGGGGEVRKDKLQKWQKQFCEGITNDFDKVENPFQFLQYVGQLLFGSLFIEDRLHMTKEVSSYDSDNEVPQELLQLLFSRIDVLHELQQEILRVFRRKLVFDISAGQKWRLKIFEYNELPEWPKLHYADPRIKEKSLTIEDEGEGIRSYVALILAILLGQRPLYLIDEPENCLHPMHAQALGRFIGGWKGIEKDSASRPCLMVTTHSSFLLRGILESNAMVSVIRMQRTGEKFIAKALTSSVIKTVTTKPRSKAEFILDGLFSSAVVLCEADGDRLVYETTMESLKNTSTAKSSSEEDQKTLHVPFPDIVRFIPVYGKGGFKESVNLFRQFGIPIVVIGDIDYLLDPSLLEVFQGLGAEDTLLNDVRQKINEFEDSLRAQDKSYNPDAVIQNLREMSSREWSSEAGAVEGLRKELKSLDNLLKPLREFKTRGEAGISADLKPQLRKLLKALNSKGLFLVPCGNLESWIPDLMIGYSPISEKQLWASEAARKIEANKRGKNDVWEFMEGVLNYLESSKPNANHGV